MAKKSITRLYRPMICRLRRGITSLLLVAWLLFASIWRRLSASKSETQCFRLLSERSKTTDRLIGLLNSKVRLHFCVCYLLLRALDTIEDDMSLPLYVKEQLLLNFHGLLEEDRPDEEKLRPLLIRFGNIPQYHFILAEYEKFNPAQQRIIRDLVMEMEVGFAEFWKKGGSNVFRINTLKDYRFYSRVGGGIVTRALTEIMILEDLVDYAAMSDAESIGDLFQRADIVCDLKDDSDEGRQLWPREIWSKHVQDWDDLFNPVHRASAVNCASEMVLDALQPVESSLACLSCFRDKSCFCVFSAFLIKGLAILESCFREDSVFESVPRRHRDELAIIAQPTVRVLKETVSDIIARLQHKNTPADPSYSAINVRCSEIQQALESIVE